VNLFRPPLLSRRRIWLAFSVAIISDGLQLLLGPLGWVFVDQAIDVVAMILIWPLIGFHVLLLPTVVAEFIPVVEMLPTWTGCVGIVVALRKKQESSSPSTPPPAIDV